MPLELQQNPQGEDTSFKDRLLAMKLLRENMYLANPGLYGMTDIAEDLPGSLRPLGDIVKDVLPSRMIISKDPEQRKRQLDDAVQRIKNSRQGQSNLGGEMLSNAVSMGAHSIAPSFIFAAIARLAGGGHGLSRLHRLRASGRRALSGTPQQRAALGKSVLPSLSPTPDTYNTSLKRFLPSFTGSQRAGTHWKPTLKHLASDTMTNAAMAATAGAATPLISRYADVSDKAIEQARKIMEEQPYITSLPTNEMLSVIRAEKENNGDDKMRNALLGGVVGAGSGAVGGTIPTLFSGGGAVLKSLVRGKPLMSGINRRMTGQMLKNMRASALMGGALGAVTGPEVSMMNEEA